MSTFIVTWNPKKKDAWEPSDREAAIRQTATGQRFEGGWATGNRKSGITPGQDRVFLLRQGPEPRGIVGSGWFTSTVHPGNHWNRKPGEGTNYADISWDVMLKDADLLPLALLKSQITRKDDWEPQGGGVLLAPPADAALETLWASHTRQSHPAPKGQGHPKPKRVVKRRKSQGWQVDPIKRKLVEDHAQALLEQHYRKMKWKVTDTHQGNSFDAVATKLNQTRYLEAKGTETDGVSVQVTSGEVEYARAHLGECVIGIVSGIVFHRGVLDVSSGTLAIHDWDPDSGELKPTRYRWAPA